MDGSTDVASSSGETRKESTQGRPSSTASQPVLKCGFNPFTRNGYRVGPRDNGHNT
jgi:hypothetical protein